MKRELAISAAAAMLLLACNPEPQTPRPVDPQPVTPKSETPASAGSAAPAADSSNFAAVQDRLTQTLRKFGAEQQKVPASINDLVAAGYLLEIPSAPRGKKWTINAERMQVTLGND